MKLDTPAPYVRMLGNHERNTCACCNQRPRFVRHPAINQYVTRQNKRPGSLATCRQALRLHGKIQPDPLGPLAGGTVNIRWDALNQSFN